VLDGTCVEPVKEMPATLGEVQRTLPTSAAFACPLVTTFITPAKNNRVYATSPEIHKWLRTNSVHRHPYFQSVVTQEMSD
jgi:hypothetical protein